ncbi:hypothetical protein Rs2_19346 [Raphanus sativus]|nr:hypothetical protein Rs2_19346 [Raphanus sativus]
MFESFSSGTYPRLGRLCLCIKPLQNLSSENCCFQELRGECTVPAIQELGFSGEERLSQVKRWIQQEWYYWDGSVSGQTLKRLVYRRDDDDASGPKPCVTFDTPGLVYLEYSDVVEYENIRLDSLVEVRLDLQLTRDQILRKNVPESVGFAPVEVSTLFMGIRNVKILCLSPDALDVSPVLYVSFMTV